MEQPSPQPESPRDKARRTAAESRQQYLDDVVAGVPDAMQAYKARQSKAVLTPSEIFGTKPPVEVAEPASSEPTSPESAGDRLSARMRADLEVAMANHGPNHLTTIRLQEAVDSLDAGEDPVDVARKFLAEAPEIKPSDIFKQPSDS